MRNLKQNPPKWHEVYQGTDERRFFVGADGRSGLARGKKDGKSLTWRSIGGLAADSGLSKKQCEEIINRFVGSGVVVNNPASPENWGYWENVGEVESVGSLSDSDKEERVNKVLGTSVKTQIKKPKPSVSNSAPAGAGAVAPAPVPVAVP